MLKTNLTKGQIRFISYLITAVGILTATTVVFFTSSQKYKLQTEIMREQALNQLGESIDAMVIALEKGMYASTGETMDRLSASLSARTVSAKTALAQIEQEDIYTDDIYRFLSQVGDCTGSICVKLSEGENITADDKQNMSVLLKYAKQLSDSLSKINSDYLDGMLTFEESKTNLTLYDTAEVSLFSDDLNDISQSFVDYPSLIYDGPFSDGNTADEALFTKNKPEITKKEAKKFAADLLGVSTSEILSLSDEQGALPLYRFSRNDITVGITKLGGYLCYILNAGYAGESTISEKSAVKRGRDFLKSIGYGNMTDTYYSVYDGICTVNYAYKENNTVCYPDLIKVQISLETGAAVGIDARTFLMNHRMRDIPKPAQSKEEAQKMILPSLEILSSRLAIIPTDTQKEYFCREFHCRDENGQELLIYIDCETGQERDILILTYGDGGSVRVE